MKPLSPCGTCKDHVCEDKKLARWSCKKYRSYASRLRAHYLEDDLEPGEKPGCDDCDLSIHNPYTVPVRVGVFVQPFDTYCRAMKKRVGSRACRGFHYPIWCPKNRCNSTCMECGRLIFEEEGDTCRVCRKKHKRG